MELEKNKIIVLGNNEKYLVIDKTNREDHNCISSYAKWIKDSENLIII